MTKIKNLKVTEYFNTAKMTLTGLGIAVTISLSGCGMQQLQLENENLQQEVQSMENQKESLQQEIQSMENQKENLTSELSELDFTREQLEEEITDLSNERQLLSTEIENRQNEINSLNQKEYYLKDLYFLDTSLLDSSRRNLYYILESNNFSSSLVCKPIENSTLYNCSYLGTSSVCSTESYNTIGLENEEIFYKTYHFGDNIFENPSCLTVQSPNYNYYVELEAGSIDHNPENHRKFTNFENIIVPLENILNQDDLKLTYTRDELITLMNEMNSGNYNFYGMQSEVGIKK